MYLQADITDLNSANPPRTGYQKDLGNKAGRAICKFDPSANSDERSIAAHGLGLTIPKDSFVKAFYYVETTFTSSTDAATIALSVVGANDLVSAIAISNGGNPWDAGAAVDSIADHAAANWVKTTADSEITATVAVEALTAGKLYVMVEWYWFGGL